MIINCIYETNTDVGLFESEALLNTQTGEVFNIVESEGDDMENIDTIYSTEVIFKFKDIEYTATVDDDEDTGGYTIKDSNEFEIILAIQRHDNFDSNLQEKIDKKPKKKI